MQWRRKKRAALGERAIGAAESSNRWLRLGSLVLFVVRPHGAPAWPTVVGTQQPQKRVANDSGSDNQYLPDDILLGTCL